MTILGTCLELQSDFTFLTQIMICGHPQRRVSITNLTKEAVTILRDNRLGYDSHLTYRYNIHGVETVFKPNDLFLGYNSIDDAPGKYAEKLGFFRIIEENNRKYLYPVKREINGIELVEDPLLFFEEARVLGKLSLDEKIVLAGHRNRMMTLQSYCGVAQILLADLVRLRNELHADHHQHVAKCVDRADECASEMMKKVTYYPKNIERLKRRLVNLDDIASPLLIAQLREVQGDFSREIALSVLCLRGAHLVRSLLFESKIYPFYSKSVETESGRFQRVHSASDFFPKGASKLDIADSVLGILEKEVSGYLSS